MPKAVTVWAVELGGGRSEEVEGSLSLEPDALVFTPVEEGRGQLRVALADIVKARRLRGSPVLIVVRRGDAGSRRTAFFFVQPPPLAPQPRNDERPSPLGSVRSSRRRTHRRNVSYLGAWAREMKAVLKEWEQAVREAAASARR